MNRGQTGEFRRSDGEGPEGTRVGGAYSTQKPHPVDRHVGSRVRLRRLFLGYSQEKLAGALGLTFQQIQRYERGANRISASKLYELSLLLDVPVTFFFEELEETQADGTHRPDTLELVSAFQRISDPEVRREILVLLRTLGQVG